MDILSQAIKQVIEPDTAIPVAPASSTSSSFKQLCHDIQNIISQSQSHLGGDDIEASDDEEVESCVDTTRDNQYISLDVDKEGMMMNETHSRTGTAGNEKQGLIPFETHSRTITVASDEEGTITHETYSSTGASVCNYNQPQPFSPEPQTPKSPYKFICSGCGNSIKDKHLLGAMDTFWHEECLKCSSCNCRLIDAGCTFYTRENILFCRKDYLRMYGSTGYCCACHMTIQAYEMVMRVKGNTYHLNCFTCNQCGHRFCSGERFYLCEGRPLCEYDYEERMVFASINYNYNALLHMKEQTRRIGGRQATM